LRHRLHLLGVHDVHGALGGDLRHATSDRDERVPGRRDRLAPERRAHDGERQRQRARGDEVRAAERR
jgi:hypothetical protein